MVQAGEESHTCWYLLQQGAKGGHKKGRSNRSACVGPQQSLLLTALQCSLARSCCSRGVPNLLANTSSQMCCTTPLGVEEPLCNTWGHVCSAEAWLREENHNLQKKFLTSITPLGLEIPTDLLDPRVFYLFFFVSMKDQL